jgi:hypothetical protein
MTRHRLDEEDFNLGVPIGRADEIKETEIEYNPENNEVEVIFEMKVDGEWRKYIEVYDRVGIDIGGDDE